MQNQQSHGNQVTTEKMLEWARKTRGYLYKKSRSWFETWQKRYFIILNHSLMYYADETLDYRKGVIELKDIKQIYPHQVLEFVVQAKTRKYEFKCESKKDRDLWLPSLNLLINQNLPKKALNNIYKSSSSSKRQPDKNYIATLEQVLTRMKLEQLKSMLSNPIFFNRIYCVAQPNGFYIIFSIKSLQIEEVDDKIMSQKYISPYEFNKLYSVQGDQVIQVNKMSQMTCCKLLEKYSQLSVEFNKQEVQIPIQNDFDGINISKVLERAHNVALQFYNPHKIKLKKNVDLLIHLYDCDLKKFQNAVYSQISNHFRQYLSKEENACKKYLNTLEQLRKSIVQTEEAFRVKSPFREETKNYFLRLSHKIVCKGLGKAWESLYSYFSLKDLLRLSYWVYEYWLLVNSIVSDPSLIEGVTELTRIYLRRTGQKIRQSIESIQIQKVELKKDKSDIFQNQITSIFLNWLYEVNSNLSESVPVQSVFQQYAKFLCRIFMEFADYVNEIADKWTETIILIAACNDVSRIRQFLENEVCTELCKGPTAHSKFQKGCGNKVKSELNSLMNNLIRKAFLLTFRSIDRKILSKSFLSLNLGKICYEVLQRIEPFKKTINPLVQERLIMLSFDEVCFFLFLSFVKKPQKSINQHILKEYINGLERAVTEIQQYYSNIKTEQKVKPHLKKILYLKDFVTCRPGAIKKYCNQLHRAFGQAFNDECIRNLISLRVGSDDEKEYMLSLCNQELKNNSSDGSNTEMSLESHQNSFINSRSRKSTLTYSFFENRMEQMKEKKSVKEGYLFVKKIFKTEETSYEESYFRIKRGCLFEYPSQLKNKIKNSIPLNKIDKCSLDPKNEHVIVIEIIGQKYRFKAPNREQAGKWVQTIYSEIGNPISQNKVAAVSKKQAVFNMFKDYDVENLMLNTERNKKNRTGESEEAEKHVSLIKKRQRNLKRQVEKKEKTIEKYAQINSKKYRSRRREQKDDEGSCCSPKIF